MSKYLFGILTGIAGALALRGAYVKGRKRGHKDCTDTLDIINAVQKFKEKKNDEES